MGSKHSKETTSISNASYHIPVGSGRIPFVALQEATNNFNDSLVIGKGGFGKVYRGVLSDGTKVALKRCKPESQQGLAAFDTEIEILSQFHHPYLVSLIGYCEERDEMCMVYEYLENSTLRSHLNGSNIPRMSWEQRLEICIGAATGLHYLHTNSVIHCDVKSTNILLDENFVAKITVFGLSKTIHSLAEWARKWQLKGQLERIIDPYLLGKIRPDSLRKFGETAVKCLALSGEDRPSMGDVLWSLEYALHLQESVVQDNPEENSTIPIGELSPQINDSSHVDASDSAAQINSSNSHDHSGDGFFRFWSSENGTYLPWVRRGGDDDGSCRASRGAEFGEDWWENGSGGPN
ncbi:Receptor-like protein kinase HERK 1 [Capsicum annuum]|nr:Receptor-like protein kinase HERK 1 [Capsicum annuum]